MSRRQALRSEWLLRYWTRHTYLRSRCARDFRLLLRLRDVRRAAHRGQRNPRWKRSSRRCVIALRNVRARRTTLRERENRRCDGDVFCCTAQFHAFSASAISSCGLISRGRRRGEKKQINDVKSWREEERERTKRIQVRVVLLNPILYGRQAMPDQVLIYLISIC